MKSDIFEEFRGLIDNHEDEIRKIKSSGKQIIGYVCCYFPVEIVHALGMVPVRLVSSSVAAMQLGKEYFHENMCPFTRATIGEFMKEGSVYRSCIDLLTGVIMCVQARNMLTVLKKYTGKPMFFFAYPLNPVGAGEKEFFINEVHHLVRSLEEFAGNRLDSEALKKSVDLYNKIRGKLTEIYNLQTVSGAADLSDVLQIIHAGFFLEPERYLDLISEIPEKLSRKVKDHPPQNDKLRIMISGSIITPGDMKVINIIESAGGRIIADDVCSGRRTFDGLIIEKPAVEDIAYAYLNAVPCATVSDPDFDHDRRLNYMSQLIKLYDIEGVIYYCIRFCDAYAFKDMETRKFLERFNIPMLAIHSEYGESDTGQIRTRIEAFIEILKKRRDL